MRKTWAIAIALIGALTIAGCSSSTGNADAAGHAANKAGRAHAVTENQSLVPPTINNNVEYHNYFKAQETYDDPSTILWCTTTWGNANSPLVTVPVAGKLTSSSVSLYPSSQVKIDNNTNGQTYNPELPSVDGMFHGTPSQYRYGFTPGGQYVDFFNMSTLCTTALTSFQRESTRVNLTIDSKMAAAQAKAEAALEACIKANKNNCPEAQAALKGGLG